MIARGALLAILLGGLLGSVSFGGTIHGRVFSAAHEDSLVPGAPVTLVIVEGEAEPRRLQAATDASGHFHFHDLSSDPSIEYTLVVEHRGREFMGGAMQFPDGEDEIEFNLLLTGGGTAPDELPAGHPPTGERPRFGQPVAENPVHSVLIMLWIFLLFVGLWIWSRRPADRGALAKLPPKARSLIRDIASLDNRREDGVVGEEEYRKIRNSLLEQVRSLSRRSQRS